MELMPKPCPYCHKLPEVYEYDSMINNITTMVIYCPSCDCPFDIHGTNKDEIIKYWNKTIEEIERR